MAEVVLTDDQINKIRKNRKDPRPAYFNSFQSLPVVISEDFEAFLILLDEAVKQQAITQLKASKEKATGRKDRDEVLALAIANENDDSNTKLNALNSEFSAFDEFKKKFTLEGFETVAEAGNLLSDLQLVLGERLSMRDRMQHLNTFMTVLKLITDPNYVKETKLKEIDSWIAVITAYQGLR